MLPACASQAASGGARSCFLSVLFALALSACSIQGNDMTTTQNGPQDEPLRKLNPNPKQGYRITMTIADAPGPLVLTDARAQYDVTNEVPCGKAIPNGGGVYRMTSNEPLVLAKVSDTVYEGMVYADQILDEDYYGDGVCHWELTDVRAVLSATGNPVETQFIPHISAEAVRKQSSEISYFANLGYPRRGIDGFDDSGQPDPNRFRPEIRDELFSITMDAKEVRP
jgi:hypothetical protein